MNALTQVELQLPNVMTQSCRARATQEKILLVDDSETDRLRLTRTLEGLGYTVVTATNGQEAMEILSEESILLIVTDLNMPVMSGQELCTRLKSSEAFEQPYVVVLTASDEGEDLIRCMEAGADDYVRKNARRDELRVRVEAGARILCLRRKLQANNQHLNKVVDQLEQARQQVDAELQFAGQLQKEYIPENQWLTPELELATLFETTRGIGGDSMGVISPAPGKTLIYQIDVMGHGIASAMLTFTLQNTLRQMFNYHIHSGELPPLHQFARRLNERFPSEKFSGHYFTLVIALIDESEESLSLCQAGHPHPFVVTPEGQLIRSERGSFPIGLFEFADYETRTLPFPAGSSLVISSDGLYDLENSQNETLGASRVHDLVNFNRHESAEAIVQKVASQRTRWAGDQPLVDDLSLMVVKRKADPAKTVMTEQPLELNITSDATQVDEALSDLVDYLSRSKVGEQTVSRIHTVVAEALNNLVEHAQYPFLKSKPPIQLRIERSTSWITATLIDGARKTPDLCPPKPLSLERESGRGIHIMLAWTDQLSHKRENDQNHWQFKFKH